MRACGRVNLGFRASLVGAADGDGAAPIALSCGDRLYPTQQRSLASTHITHKFTRASATRKDHSPGATINKFDWLQAEHDRQFPFARKPSTKCVWRGVLQIRALAEAGGGWRTAVWSLF